MKLKKDGSPKKSGGKRENAGRKSIFNEKTKGVKFTCPVSRENDLRDYVALKLLEWAKVAVRAAE